jgi:hypothetical protein
MDLGLLVQSVLSVTLPMSLIGDLCIHRVRRQIDFSWPGYRALINEDLREKLQIQQRCEHAREVLSPQLDVTSESVLKADE